jgi:hypothetical protein
MIDWELALKTTTNQPSENGHFFGKNASGPQEKHPEFQVVAFRQRKAIFTRR